MIDDKTTKTMTHEFICEDCDDYVCKYGDHDGIAMCQTCRYIRERHDMPEHIKQALLGDR